MSRKTADLRLEGDGLRFVASAGSGHPIVLDDGAGDTGMRPAELLAVSLAGCTAMDVISILRKKRQPVTRYEVHAEAEQRDAPPPAIFLWIEVTHTVEGGPELEVEAVRRSIELSATKYCAVGATLATGITELHHRYLVRRPGLPDATGEVLVEGPFATNALPEPIAAG
jgi:putative redox protein